MFSNANKSQMSVLEGKIPDDEFIGFYFIKSNFAPQGRLPLVKDNAQTSCQILLLAEPFFPLMLKHLSNFTVRAQKNAQFSHSRLGSQIANNQAKAQKY